MARWGAVPTRPGWVARASAAGILLLSGLCGLGGFPAPPASAAVAVITSNGADLCQLPVVVAHRGAVPDLPENSAGAYRAALRGGAEIVEGDVRFTADGVAVVMHDDTINRTTTGRGAVGTMTYAALQRVRLANGERVPTLHAVLRLVSTYGAHMFVEIKGAPSVARVRGMLAAVDATGARVTFIAFDPARLAAVRAVRPSAATAWIDGPGARTADEVLARAPTVIKSARELTPELVATWHAAGIGVFGSTSDTVAMWTRLAAAGVDGVLTNDAPRYRVWRDAACATGAAAGSPAPGRTSRSTAESPRTGPVVRGRMSVRMPTAAAAPSSR